MMFHCLPPDSRYEWDNLRGFVAQYNERYGKKYNLSACPEKVNRNTKEPEVALEAMVNHLSSSSVSQSYGRLARHIWPIIISPTSFLKIL